MHSSNTSIHVARFLWIQTDDDFFDPGPKVAICLPMPFSAEKLKSFRVSGKLASFLLYALSPFLPNHDILDNPDILTELSTEFRYFSIAKNQSFS